MHDGTQLLGENIERQRITAEEVCRQFESLVKRKTGLNIRWAQKPMETPLLAEIKDAEREIETFEFDEDKTKLLDTTYMNSLSCYALKKRYWELFACKVLTPEVAYIFSQEKKS